MKTRNQEIAKGLMTISEGFKILSEALLNSEVQITGVDMASSEGAKTSVVTEKVVDLTKEAIKKAEKSTEAPKKVEKKEEAKETNSKIDRDYLELLSYNEVKAVAKEVGVKAVGSKASIIDNILATQEPTEEVEEEVKADIDVAEDEPDVDLEEDDEEVEEEEPSLYDEVVALVEDYTDEELADVLSSIGVSPKGKRQALLAKIVQAVEDGKLDLSDDEEENEEDTTEAPTEDLQADVEEDVEDEEAEEYDFVTEARREACEELEKDLRKQFKTKKLTHKEIIKYLKEMFEDFVSNGAEEDLDLYIQSQFDLVDEDGELHDLSDPYYIGESAYCCGAPLSEVDDEFVCEICGATYEK